MKKMFLGLILCLIVFGIFFSFNMVIAETNSTNNNDTEIDYYSCEIDDDCNIVVNGCCECINVFENVISINKIFNEEWTNQFNCTSPCTNGACLTEYTLTPKCENNQCEIEKINNNDTTLECTSDSDCNSSYECEDNLCELDDDSDDECEETCENACEGDEECKELCDETCEDDKDDDDKEKVCHIPSGDEEKAKTLEIGADSVADHLAHGDYEGWCEDDCDDEDDCEDDSNKFKKKVKEFRQVVDADGNIRTIKIERRIEIKNGRTKIMIKRITIDSKGNEVKEKIEIKIDDEGGTIKRTIKIDRELEGNETYEFETELEIEDYIDGNDTDLKAILSNGNRVFIKIMPDRASQIAMERLLANNFTLELKEVGRGSKIKAVYKAKTKKNGRFIGIFKIKIKIEGEIDPETGEFLGIDKPWWAMFVFGEDSDQTDENDSDDDNEDQDNDNSPEDNNSS